MHTWFFFGVQAAEAEGYAHYVQAGDLVQADLSFNVQLIHGTEGLIISVCVLIPFLLVNSFLVISVTCLRLLLICSLEVLNNPVQLFPSEVNQNNILQNKITL